MACICIISVLFGSCQTSKADPSFLGNLHSLEAIPVYLSFHATGSHGSQGPLWRDWFHLKTRTQLLLTPPEQHPAQNGLTVPENALRKPQTNHDHMDTANSPSPPTPQWRIGGKYSKTERVQNLASLRPLTAHNMGTYFSCTKVSLICSSFFFFHSPFCYFFQSLVLGFKCDQ